MQKITVTIRATADANTREAVEEHEFFAAEYSAGASTDDLTGFVRTWASEATRRAQEYLNA